MFNVELLLPYKEVIAASLTSPELFQQFLNTLDNPTKSALDNFADALNNILILPEAKEAFKARVIELVQDKQEVVESKEGIDEKNKNQAELNNNEDLQLASSKRNKLLELSLQRSKLKKALLTANQQWLLFSRTPEKPISDQNEDRKQCLRLLGELSSQVEASYQAISDNKLQNTLQFCLDRLEEMPVDKLSCQEIAKNLRQILARLKDGVNNYQPNTSTVQAITTATNSRAENKTSTRKFRLNRRAGLFSLAFFNSIKKTQSKQPLVSSKTTANTKAQNLISLQSTASQDTTLREVRKLQQLLIETDEKLLTFSNNSETLEFPKHIQKQPDCECKP